jgi:hypothetical protein
LSKLLIVFEKFVIITLVFGKNANFFRRKLSKIAENCDHNIDPWSFVLRVGGVASTYIHKRANNNAY